MTETSLHCDVVSMTCSHCNNVACQGRLYKSCETFKAKYEELKAWAKDNHLWRNERMTKKEILQHLDKYGNCAFCDKVHTKEQIKAMLGIDVLVIEETDQYHYIATLPSCKYKGFVNANN